ncbi:hypothetical protein MPC4_550004 [Methylocella tundrae]|uniref:Uncharacterized protein n=1 Tax=Methylocella tundrae TaxID=227605 RepID=A0A8B6MCU5_METTU|nr:hypothetical protein MPC4_550004 [Methylocella tundrae]
MPVTIRLLDPPLHEFLPQSDEEIAEVAASMGVPADTLKRRAAELHEFNPMLSIARACISAISGDSAGLLSGGDGALEACRSVRVD